MTEHPLNALLWIEELLPMDVEAMPKHGGMAYYMDLKLVMILVERGDGERSHKGTNYDFELWNGCILPVEQKKQNAFFLKFSFLENHPANRDWLYIPAESENFEDEVRQYLREITKRNPLLGTPVKISGPKRVKSADAAPKAKKAPKADKKRENTMLMSMLKIKK